MANSNRETETFALGLIVAAILYLIFRREFGKLGLFGGAGANGAGAGALGGAGFGGGGAGGAGGAGSGPGGGGCGCGGSGAPTNSIAYTDTPTSIGGQSYGGPLEVYSGSVPGSRTVET
jgi:hypothetical protein